MNKKVLVRKPQEKKKLLGKPTCRWEDTIKMDLKVTQKSVQLDHGTTAA
jgi:hypothetical protein